MRQLRVGLFGLSLLAAGCQQACSPTTKPTPKSAAITSGSSHPATLEPKPTASSSTEPSEKELGRRALREGHLATADSRFAAAEQLDPPDPALKLARAVIALRRGDADLALTFATAAREAAVTASSARLEAEAQRWQSLAARASTTPGVARRLLSESSAPEDQLAVARDELMSGDVSAASTRIAQLLKKMEQRSRRARPDEELLRELLWLQSEAARQEQEERKARSGLSTNQLTVLRRLASEHAGTQLGERARAQLRELQVRPELPLTLQLARLERLAAAGRHHELDTELTRLPPAAATQRASALTELRARALYLSRDDDAGAAALFRAAARSSPQRRSALLIQAGRAELRAGRLEEAEALLAPIARGTSPEAASASLQRLRAEFFLGRYRSVRTHAREHLRRFPRDGTKRDVERLLAIALLAEGEGAAARPIIEGLASRERDPREQLRLKELLAVSAELRGEFELSRALQQAVIDEGPLTLPGLFAVERLAHLDASPDEDEAPLPEAPPSDAPSRSSLRTLPADARALLDVGLDELAETILTEAEPTLKSTFGPKSGELLCDLYGQLDTAARRYQIAQWAVSQSWLDSPPTPENRWAHDCLFPRPNALYAAEVAQREQVPLWLLYGVMRQESGFRPAVVSGAGAIGLLQLIPSTAARVAEELGLSANEYRLEEPATNIRFGAHYLGRLLTDFGGSHLLSAAAYNAGPRAVHVWLRQGAKLPADLFAAAVPYDETRNYIARVLGNAARYSALISGASARYRVPLELPKGLTLADDAY